MVIIHRRTVKKKDLNDPEYHDGVITHLQPDILECKVKWALGSITTNKASGGDSVPVELVQILKDDALNMPANMETQQWPQNWKKVSFPSNLKEGQCQRMFKLPYNFAHFTC